MAKAVADGAKDAGAEVDILKPADFTAEKAAEYDAVALGCPAMGAEQLEETEFEPMFEAVKTVLSGKKVALFGSYGWGDGEFDFLAPGRAQHEMSISSRENRSLDRAAGAGAASAGGAATAIPAASCGLISKFRSGSCRGCVDNLMSQTFAERVKELGLRSR